MDFCPPNVTVLDVWLNDGLSHCFIDTISSAIISGFLLVFGTIQLFIYRKYGTANEDVQPTRLFTFQLCLHLFVPVLALTRFMLQATAYDGSHTIYGYMVRFILFQYSNQVLTHYSYQVVEFASTFFAYIMAISLVVKERFYKLPSPPSYGHGLVLLVTWMLQLIVENLALMNMKSTEWQDLSSRRNQIELILFGLRYASCLFIFVLGLKAPGISRPSNDTYDHLSESGNDVSLHTLCFNQTTRLVY